MAHASFMSNSLGASFDGHYDVSLTRARCMPLRKMYGAIYVGSYMRK